MRVSDSKNLFSRVIYFLYTEESKNYFVLIGSQQDIFSQFRAKVLEFDWLIVNSIAMQPMYTNVFGLVGNNGFSFL